MKIHHIEKMKMLLKKIPIVHLNVLKVLSKNQMKVDILTPESQSLPFSLAQTGFNPFKVVLPPREKEEEEKVEHKKPKTLYDYRRQLVFKEQEKWIEYHRTVKKKKEIEQINNEKEIPSYIQYIRRIIEINPQTQKAQLRRIEEELIEKRALVNQKLKKMPESVGAERDE